MPFHFCPQCGTKLQPGFRFCPSCGEKIPCIVEESGPVSPVTSLSLSPAKKDEAVVKSFPVSVASGQPTGSTDNGDGLFGTPPKQQSPRPGRGKARRSSPAEQAEEGKSPNNLSVHGPLVAVSSPVSSPKSQLKGKSKSKKAKHASAVEPLQEGEEVTDTAGKKWKLVKLLSQSTTELLYEVLQIDSRSNSKESITSSSWELKMAESSLSRTFCKELLNLCQWTESYRFLIFPNMGQSLHSVMEEEDELLSEKAVLQLACRILDVLQYIHSNEYVHADINAENIYIKPGQKSQVYLVGYCHAFRYCPGDQHVEYREDCRTPHEGSVEFISLDAHKGAAPSRRSDLQSLGYCMLHWHTGTLPWTQITDPDQVATQKQRYMKDVPALLSHCFEKNTVSSAFEAYLTNVMALQYTEQPDYSALKAGLSAVLLQLGGAAEQPLSF
ncbi:Inactive serine/threonine-protein kinase VRK3 [Dissostichus eleginoides]|uniref:Inactive serine/threonine-protein kinase VRK3 n=1 Tax=Dissostichus eleginoides TaxID=100907 RepID=A0AAD9BXX1_DISEL|nr:Inactive serine/threonine-protein kinase VRK3 [Dissostichus eleginoides]